VCRPWVAEAALQKLEVGSPSLVTIDDGTGGFRVSLRDPNIRKARSALDRARNVHATYLHSGRVTDELLNSAIGLAQLDVIYRCGYVDPGLGRAHAEDRKDLRNLLALVRPETFRARTRCLLNPTFGEGSQLIGGADADLVIDDVLIDVKTIKNFELTRGHFNQLMGYHALHRLSGFGEGQSRRPLKELGIYFARHGHLETFTVAALVDRTAFPGFLKWFKAHASQETRPPGHRKRK
jgi:hypothetical protein